MIRYEADFERQLKEIAPLCNCRYYKIPDTKMLNAANRYQNREKKRPFDGVLVTPDWNWCVECKYGYAKLSDHQKINQADINIINGRFLVLRKIKTKKRTYYKIESIFGNFKTDKIEDIFKFAKLKHYRGE